MKNLLMVVVLLSMTGIASLAQKSPTYIHSGKAIKGYDAVAYFADSKPVLGNDSLSLEWNNAT